jgi:hypothetical protein
MSWLERIDEREARRVAKAISAGALETRDLAEDHLTQFAKQARAIAEPRLHEAADYIKHEGSAVAKAAARQAGRATRFAEHARASAEPHLQDAVDYLRHEGTAVAKLAARQAGRATRAAKADPLPVIVGVVGVALLASLVLGRRRT